MTTELALTTSRPIGSTPRLTGEAMPCIHHAGRFDALSENKILTRMQALPAWRSLTSKRAPHVLRQVVMLLQWLKSFPGEGWQARWESSRANDPAWIDAMVAADARSSRHARSEIKQALGYLLLLRLFHPSYGFLRAYRAFALLERVREEIPVGLARRVEQAAKELGLIDRRKAWVLATLSKLLLHTGKSLDELDVEDFLEAQRWTSGQRGHQLGGLHDSWELCRAIGVLPVQRTLRAASLGGQRPTAELVDQYQLRSRVVRGVIVRYCEERRPALDYGSFRELVGLLAGTFWADLEHHHPGIDSLHLTDEVAASWKQRMTNTSDPRMPARPRRGRLQVFTRVRAFYLDIAEWALHDPSWVAFAVPCPIRKSDTAGMTKVKKKVTAEMHQRVRDRLPHLQHLLDTAHEQRITQASLLAAASATPDGLTFRHDGITYTRLSSKAADHDNARQRGSRDVYIRVHGTSNGKRINLTTQEDRAFWAWATIDTLHHTGVRIEELLEITHLALVSYQLPDTGEIVPLLQIVPSKSNAERLLLVSPELASTLATIVNRVRDHNGRVPLIARYDPHERLAGPQLPHLFQRATSGQRDAVIDSRTVQRFLNDILTLSGVTDNTGQPLRYTPHDFRRMFATEAVSGGLPVHIAAKILGHENINTTQAYLAVFQDALIRSYRSFLAQRRATRPSTEYRQPTEQEWNAFHQHFLLRKVELGTCARPYGTPCNHEHACIRCPMLRVDPKQRHRLVEIVSNLTARIDEAQAHGWLGEVQGLQTSLTSATDKLSNLDQRTAPAGTSTELGIPSIRSI